MAYKIGKLYDSNGVELKSGQICICQNGSIAKEPFIVEIFECYEDILTIDLGIFLGNTQKVLTPYLCTRLYPDATKEHDVVIWDYWSKLLTVMENHEEAEKKLNLQKVKKIVI